jgi:hypothetical protein
MGYNPYRWWTKGRKNKPLPAHAPIFDKIKNGDYDYSYLFAEADEMKSKAKQAYDETYKNYGGTDEKNRIEVSLDASRMKRLKAIKLQLEAHKDELNILYKLRKDLQSVFGVDLWDEAVENVDGDLIELYTYYKKKVNEGQY